MDRLIQFFNHLLLIEVWGQDWFDCEDETPLIELIENNNYDVPIYKILSTGDKVTSLDLVSAMKKQPSQTFLRWLRETKDTCEKKGVKDNHVVTSCMGCGSSDYLHLKDLKNYLRAYEETL